MSTKTTALDSILKHLIDKDQQDDSEDSINKNFIEDFVNSKVQDRIKHWIKSLYEYQKNSSSQITSSGIKKLLVDG